MAREETTSSDAISIHELLEGAQIYQMPLFQREYAWRSVEINRFWDDLRRVVEGETDTAFLGALVLQMQNRGGSARSAHYVVIDGQQRLTTFYLTICALAEHAQSKGWIDLTSDLETQYIVSRLRSEDNQAKLVPTPRDNAQFNNVLRNLNHPQPSLLPNLGMEKGRLSEAYARTQDKLSETLDLIGSTEDRESFDFLREVFFDKLEIVQIVLTKSHDANEVFDRLNTSGRPLRVIDLVRNEVFQGVANISEASQLYDHSWEPFEKALLGTASEKEVADRQRQEDNFFFPYCLIHDQNAAKNRLFVHLRKYWDSFTTNADGLDKAELIVEDLRLYIEPYLALHAGDKPANIGANLWSWILKLRNIPLPTVTYPFLMQLLRRHSDGLVSEDASVLACRIIESFFVRRAFAGFEPTGLHTIFKQLWGRCNGEVNELVRHLQTSTIHFPGDEQTKENILNGNLYPRRICKYILAEYEWHLQAKSAEPAVALPEITIDHVMPQSRSEGWKQVISAEEHDKLVHVWGNLVPLSQPLNSLKNARNFEETAEILAEESQFRSVREVYANFSKWDASSIRRRTEELTAWAIERWPSF